MPDLFSETAIARVDAAASLLLFAATILAFYAYQKTTRMSTKWLVVGFAFLTLAIISISNVLEWGRNYNALDPAEDYLVIFALAAMSYILTSFRKEQ